MADGDRWRPFPQISTTSAVWSSLCHPPTLPNINTSYGLGFVWIPWVALKAGGGLAIGGLNTLIPTQLIMASPLKALSPWLWRYQFWSRLHCSNYLEIFRQPQQWGDMHDECELRPIVWYLEDPVIWRVTNASQKVKSYAVEERERWMEGNCCLQMNY